MSLTCPDHSYRYELGTSLNPQSRLILTKEAQTGGIGKINPLGPASLMNLYRRAPLQSMPTCVPVVLCSRKAESGFGKSQI